MSAGRHIEIIDCTLRDGEQAPGVWFDPDEKVTLATALSDAGVDVLDAGFPASSPVEIEILQELRARGLRARIGATARAVAADVEAAARARAHEVFLFMPTSDLRLERTLGITRAQARQRMTGAALDAAALGLGVNIVFEDATRADPGFMLGIVAAVLAEVPVARVIIADTVGCGLPSRVEALFARFGTELGEAVAVVPHCHNDFGLATANTVAAVAAGARAVTCTVNGLGERAGNADLAETAAALTHLLGVSHGLDPRRLPELSALVERMSGVHTSAIKPVTGANVFRHESGVHVDGMLKDPRSYEFLPAAWTGRETEYVLGKHSGVALIRHLLERAGLPADELDARALLDAVKAERMAGGKADHHEAHDRCLRDRELLLAGVRPTRVADLHAERIATAAVRQEVA